MISFVEILQPEWYPDIVEFLTTQQLSGKWTKEDMRNVRVNSNHFVEIGVIGHRTYVI